MAAITHKELARALPNRQGGRGVHPKTILNRVAGGELPPFDFHDKCGTKGWIGNTLKDLRIAPFIEPMPAPPAPEKQAKGNEPQRRKRKAAKRGR